MAFDELVEGHEDALAILEIVKGICKDSPKGGAYWDGVVTAGKMHGYTEEQVEGYINRLMDQGKLYEPTLGVLKVV